MTQDVRQWLAEIKTLQQQLAELRQERDEAYTSAANWRKLYETEAKQRRTEAAIAKQAHDQLKAEVQRLRELPSDLEPLSAKEIERELSRLKTTDDLKARLAEVLTECDRLQKALKQQQVEYAQAKDALTVALGDTVDALTKERALRQGAPHQNGNGHAAHRGDESSKTPSPEQPSLDQAKSLV